MGNAENFGHLFVPPVRFTAGMQQVTAMHDFGHNQMKLKGSNLPIKKNGLVTFVIIEASNLETGNEQGATQKL